MYFIKKKESVVKAHLQKSSHGLELDCKILYEINNI